MKNHIGHLERIMRELVDSVVLLSDDEVRAEVAEGADPDEEAEQTLTILRDVSRKFDNVNKHLTKLGHRINSSWRHDQRGYQNRCAECGLSASFTLAGKMRGEAFNTLCSANGGRMMYARQGSR